VRPDRLVIDYKIQVIKPYNQIEIEIGKISLMFLLYVIIW